MSNDNLWMPLYVGDYLADTMELNAAQHGAYLLLLMYYWRNGPLPVDDARLAAIARTERRAWDREVGAVVKAFFGLENGRLHQKRADLELAKARGVSAKRRAAAEARWRGNGSTEPPTTPDANAYANAHPHASARALQKPSKRNPNGPASALHVEMHVQCTRAPAVQHNTTQKKDSALRAAPETPAPDVRAELWNEGVEIAKALIGLPIQRTRTFIGKLLRDAGDNCPRVLQALRQAQIDRPIDPAAWLIASLQPNEKFRNAARALPRKLLPGEPSNVVQFAGVTIDAEPDIQPQERLCHG